MADALTLRRAYKGNRFQLPQRLRVWESIGDRVRVRSRNPLFYLCAFVIAASLLLGGGTRGGFFSDAALQLAAIPLLLAALWKLFDVPITQQMRIPLLFCLSIVIIPVVQLIPLPPWLWTNLPGRQPSAETFEILGQGTPWMPISVAPHETWLSALSLIPPMAIFLATLQLHYRDRRSLTWVFLAVGVVSVFIGMLQIAQGPASTLRFFEITNESEAVGFFANRNHFAALLYALTLFAVAWTINVTVAAQEQSILRFETIILVAFIGAFTLLVVLLAGQMMTRSRIGLGLTIGALFGGIALGMLDRRVAWTSTPIKILSGAGILVFVFGFQFALYRVMERFDADLLNDYRLPIGGNTFEAALSYLPLGSGLGTFVPVYSMFEKPENLWGNVYANRAHNDFLELWLNTGIIGLTLAGMFIVWLGLRAIEIWRSAPPRDASDLDWDLARVATLIVGFLIVHSYFDYPLRTGAIMAVMAFACALLIEPPFNPEQTVASPAPPPPKRTSEKTKKAPQPDGEEAVLAPIKKAQIETAFNAEPAVASPPSPPKRTPEKTKKASRPDGEEAVLAPVEKAQVADTPKISPATISLAPGPKKIATAPLASAPQAPKPSEGAALAPDRRWGADIEWPDEWSKKSTSSSPRGEEGTEKQPKPPKD